MNDSKKRLLISFLIGLIVGFIIVLTVGLTIYAQRYSGVVCLSEDVFNIMYNMTIPVSGYYG